MRSYVVRIYRENPEDSSRMTGIVEVVESGEKHPFQSFTELWAALSADRMAPKAEITLIHEAVKTATTR